MVSSKVGDLVYIRHGFGSNWVIKEVLEDSVVMEPLIKERSCRKDDLVLSEVADWPGNKTSNWWSIRW